MPSVQAGAALNASSVSGAPNTTGAPTAAMPLGVSTSARTVLVTTRIPNDTLLLKPGMTGMVKIYCGRRRPVDLIKRRLARTIKVEFWSWW